MLVWQRASKPQKKGCKFCLCIRPTSNDFGGHNPFSAQVLFYTSPGVALSRFCLFPIFIVALFCLFWGFRVSPLRASPLTFSKVSSIHSIHYLFFGRKGQLENSGLLKSCARRPWSGTGVGLPTFAAPRLRATLRGTLHWTSSTSETAAA